MSRIAVAAAFLTAFAAVFDPYFKPFAGPAPNVALQFLRDVTDSMKSGWYIIPAIIVVAIIGLMDWREIRTASRRALLTAYGRAAFIFASVSISGISRQHHQAIRRPGASRHGGAIRRLQLFAL